MKAFYFLVIISLSIGLFSGCQEEDVSSFRNPMTSHPSDLQNFTLDTRLSSQISFIYPRIPRPLPCPELSGCQIPRPQLLVSVAEGSILKMQVRLYTETGELYADSHEKYGGEISYFKQEALASLQVINDQVSSERLRLVLQVVYSVGGKIYSEELYDENVPIQLEEYRKANEVLYLFPRIPRPLPCPELSGCQIPNPELHLIVPDANILQVDARLYSEEGILFACSVEHCEGEMVFGEKEALARMNIVNPEIDAKNLILGLRITYERNGKIISDKFYDRDVPIALE